MSADTTAEVETNRSDMGELRSLAAALRPSRRMATIAIVTTILLGLAALVPSYLSKVLIDVGLDQQDRSVVVAVSLASAVLVIITWGLQKASTERLYLTGGRAVVSLQNELFRALMHLPEEYHQAHPAGRSVSVLTNDALAMRALITSGMPSLLTSLVSMVGALVMMLLLDWDMALVTLSVVPIFVAMSWAYRRFAGPLFSRWRQTIATITNDATGTLGAIRLVQSYNRQEHHRSEFFGTAVESRDAEYLTIRANAIYYPATSVLAAVATGLLIMYGGTQVVRGESQIGTMVAFFGYLQLFLGPLASISSILQTYQTGMAALDRMYEVIDEPQPPATPTQSAPIDDPDSVSLSGVSLDQAEHRALTDIDLQIAHGETVALVGDAASGHQELAHVIAGLLRPTEGEVTVAGADVYQTDRDALFDRIGFVSQATGLFEGTVRDNLRLVAPDASDADLSELLQGLFGAELLAGLGGGLDTDVGREGSSIPAGVRQAVIIARAILKQPEVLVLDGAVDALDAGGITHLARARRTRLSGVTIVAATSQPLIADYADRVVVLDAGAIVEEGDPTTLLRADGPFAELTRGWRAGLR